MIDAGLLPGAFDLEDCQVCTFALGELVLGHLIDAAAARAFAQRGAQFGKALFIAADDDFDVAIFRVTHPAFEGKLAGFAMHKPAKSYALDSAFDEEMEDTSLFSVADKGFSGKSEKKAYYDYSQGL